MFGRGLFGRGKARCVMVWRGQVSQGGVSFMVHPAFHYQKTIERMANMANNLRFSGSCVYTRRKGFQVAAPAQVVGEVCAKLESEGRLTPADLVDESRPDDAPLHGCFEWNDAKAAERFRETQASYIIRSVEVTPVESKEPTRAFISYVPDKDESPTYLSVVHMVHDKTKREYMLEQALRELESFRRKYRNLSELANVFDAIDMFQGSLLDDKR